MKRREEEYVQLSDGDEDEDGDGDEDAGEIWTRET